MAGDQRAILGNQHRVGEAEGADRPGDLGHLRIRMRAGIARIGHQAVERPVFDRKLACVVVGADVRGFSDCHCLYPMKSTSWLRTPHAPFWPRMRCWWRAVLGANSPEI